MAAPLNITAHRETRVNGRQDLLNLLMYTDSYHDFKGLRGKIGDKTCVPEIDKFMYASKATLPNNADLRDNTRQGILNYYKWIGIQFSKLEQSTRQYFEQQLSKNLCGTPENGTVPTVVTYSNINALAKQFIKSDVICLELDTAYQSKLTTKNMIEKNTAVGIALLSWLFPKPASNEIGFSFDAKTALISDLMSPLNDTTGPFYAVHVVTPQNILDSARTSFNVLTGLLTNAKESSRLKFVNSLNDEYANHLTSELGHFTIKPDSYSDVNRYGFKWQFQPIDLKKPAIDIPVSASKNSGPSVNFLADMALSCNDKIGNPRAVCLTKIANTSKNTSMVNPLTVLKDKSRDDFVKLCIDIKRLGDHEQANAVYAVNHEKKPCVFVTGDTLSGLYSRILGNPTMYVSTPGGGDDDEEGGSNSSILCYRGIQTDLTDEEQAIRDLEYILDTINYVLFVYQQFSDLAKASALTTLKENMETNISIYEYKDVGITPDIQQLITNLVKWRVYDILAHLNTVHKEFQTSKIMIDKAKKEFETVTANKSNSGYNVKLLGFTDKTKIGTIQSMIGKLNAALTDDVRNGIKKINTLLGYFNNAKSVDNEGNAIYTFNFSLFPAPGKISESLPFLQFYLSDMTSIGMNFVRLKAGKVTRTSTDNQLRESLSNGFNSYLSKFYNTEALDDSTIHMAQINKRLSETIFISGGSLDTAAVSKLINDLNAIAIDNTKSLQATVVNPDESWKSPGLIQTAIDSGVTNISLSGKMARAVKAQTTIKTPPSPRRSSRLTEKAKKGGAGTQTQVQYLTEGNMTTTGTTFNTTRKNRIRYKGEWMSMNNYNSLRQKQARNSALPGFVYTQIVNAILPFFTGPEYSGMLTVITGDKSIYKRDTFIQDAANLNQLNGANQQPISGANLVPSSTTNQPIFINTAVDNGSTGNRPLNSIPHIANNVQYNQPGILAGGYTEGQYGGEIINEGPGFVESDYYYSHQFYNVVRALYNIEDAVSKAHTITPEQRVAYGEATKYIESISADSAEELDEEALQKADEDIAYVKHNELLFEEIVEIWLRMDADITMAGSPDFSIEDHYPKADYNDIRRDTNYQLICEYMKGAYDSDKFTAFCSAMIARKISEMPPDTAINTLCKDILSNIVTGAGIAGDMTNNIAAVDRIILYNKIDKLDRYLTDAKITFDKVYAVKKGSAGLSENVDLLKYAIRQVEQLVDDMKIIETADKAISDYISNVYNFTVYKGVAVRQRLSSNIYSIKEETTEDRNEVVKRFLEFNGNKPFDVFEAQYNAVMSARDVVVTTEGGSRRFKKTIRKKKSKQIRSKQTRTSNRKK